MKKWEPKVISEKFVSVEDINAFVAGMASADWRLTSLCLNPFPPKTIKVGEQPDGRVGTPFILTFEREIPESKPEKPAEGPKGNLGPGFGGDY